MASTSFFNSYIRNRKMKMSMSFCDLCLINYNICLEKGLDQLLWLYTDYQSIPLYTNSWSEHFSEAHFVFIIKIYLYYSDEEVEFGGTKELCYKIITVYFIHWIGLLRNNYVYIIYVRLKKKWKKCLYKYF